MRAHDVKIKVVVQGKKKDVPGWPHINFDYDKKTEELMKCVRELNPDAEFDVVRYSSKAEAAADYEEDVKKYDGVLVLLMTNWLRTDEVYARGSVDGRLPCAVADVSFCGSGSMLEDTSPMIRREKLPVPICASTDPMDTARLARVLVTNAKIKKSTVLVVKNTVPEETEKAASENWGVKFINKNSSDLMDIYYKVTDDEAKDIYEKWTSGARKIIEPSEADILESARLYVAIQRMKEETGADAVTIDCLELSYNDIYGKNCHMYPCLTYFQMSDDDELGVCEADVDSVVTSLAVKYYTGRHGYVSDPVVDTSSQQIIYAHCVACRKVFGCSDNRVCSYDIRSHAEDQKGASVQVIFPSGEKLTTLNMLNTEKLGCIHSSVSCGNAGGDAGCRSKLVANCNADALLYNWMPKWHRVTVFGEYRRSFMQLFKLKGFDILEEDK